MKELLTKNHSMSPNGQDLISKNNSNNLSLEEIIETRVSRRSVIKGSLAVVAGSFLGMNLTGCRSSSSGSGNNISSVAADVLLGFNPVAKNLNDEPTAQPPNLNTSIFRNFLIIFLIFI